MAISKINHGFQSVNSNNNDELKIRLPPSTTPISSIKSSPYKLALILLSFLILLNTISNLMVFFKPRLTSNLSASKSLRIGSFNVRYDGESSQYTEDLSKIKKRDWSSGYGESPWRERKEKLVDSVIWSDLDVIGFQEALLNQVGDLTKLLGSTYDHVGVGRDDGKKKGEFVPIYYKKERLELLDVQHFWLSLTPNIPGSVSWDVGEAQTRMVTLAHFQDRFAVPQPKNQHFVHAALSTPPSDFYVLNTHFDDRGEVARRESAKLILKKVEELIAGQGQEKLVILVGDLNSHMTEDAYRILTGYRYARQSAIPDHLSFVDARKHLSLSSPTSTSSTPLQFSPWGDSDTFTGFSRSDTPKIIDFILLLDSTAVASDETGGKGWRVNRFGVVPNQFNVDGKMLISDHRLLVAGLEWVV